MRKTLYVLLLISGLSFAADRADLLAEVEEAQRQSIKDPMLALAISKELLGKLDEAKEPQLRLQTYAQLSNILSNLSRYPEAMQYAKDGLAFAEKLNAPEKFADEIFVLKQGEATANTFLGNTDAALTQLENLEAEAQKNNKTEQLPGIYVQKGLLYSNTGKSIEALQALSKAWELVPVADESGSGELFYLLGNAYINAGEPDRAIAMHELAVEEMKAENLSQRLSLVGYSIGRIYMTKAEYANAIKWFNNARQWAVEVNDPIGEAFNNLELGMAYVKNNEFSNAETALNACDKTFKLNGFLPQQTLLHMTRADIHLAQNKLPRALGSVIEAEKVFSNGPMPPPLKRRVLTAKMDILTKLERNSQADAIQAELNTLPPVIESTQAQLDESQRAIMQTINTDIDSKIVQFKAKRTENTEQRQTDEAKQQYQLIAIVLGGIVLLSIAVLW